jgi:hypothetical protein
MSSPHKTAEQIAAELAALQAIKPSLPPESDWGDDIMAAVDAQIAVLRDRPTLNEVYEAYEGRTYTLHRALRAWFWAAGKLAATAQSPAAHWASTLTADEQQIQAKGADVAPRITVADIEANIASEHCFTAADGVAGSHAQVVGGQVGIAVHESPQALGLLTICVLVLKNGFTVTGESACASPENFNADIGRQVARANAINKIWPLMGYELRSKLEAGRG